MKTIKLWSKGQLTKELKELEKEIKHIKRVLKEIGGYPCIRVTKRKKSKVKLIKLIINPPI